MKFIDKSTKVGTIAENNMDFLVAYLAIDKENSERAIAIKVYPIESDKIIYFSKCGISHSSINYLFKNYNVFPSENCGITIEF